MILPRRFYIILILIILLLGSGTVFAPLFVIGQWALFIFFLAVLADGYMLYRIRGIRHSANALTVSPMGMKMR